MAEHLFPETKGKALRFIVNGKVGKSELRRFGVLLPFKENRVMSLTKELGLDSEGIDLSIAIVGMPADDTLILASRLDGLIKKNPQ